ncbi:MAG: hypothetical protein H6550_05485 [Chitinophagales bacterium]|nr:hypothetical protein [Chitinophagales bacterium]
MKMNFAAYTIIVICLFATACKTKSKIGSSAKAMPEQPFVPVSIISLYDKPLDTIKRHITGQKWQLWYSVGGITGNDRHSFTDMYYTLTKDGKLITEKGGETSIKPYKWEMTRDIYTGDSTYVITGVVQWKVDGIYDDTLRLADNYMDGYGYALTRVK